MCGGGSPPPPAPPAPAPPPPEEPPMAPVLNETAANERNVISGSRSGRNSLRIDRATSAPSGGSGLNIPTT